MKQSIIDLFRAYRDNLFTGHDEGIATAILVLADVLSDLKEVADEQNEQPV